jgi:hypothetical protein
MRSHLRTDLETRKTNHLSLHGAKSEIGVVERIGVDML